MATKRVFEIAKQQGLSTREVVNRPKKAGPPPGGGGNRLKEAGLDVSAAASTVDEAEAMKVLGNGAAPVVEEKPRPTRRRATKAKAEPKEEAPKAEVVEETEAPAAEP